LTKIKKQVNIVTVIKYGVHSMAKGRKKTIQVDSTMISVRGGREFVDLMSSLSKLHGKHVADMTYEAIIAKYGDELSRLEALRPVREAE
jgi:hypothetical protein